MALPTDGRHITRLSQNIPLARGPDGHRRSKITVSRANRSVGACIDHVVDCLSRGEQRRRRTVPMRWGYLSAPTAVYGSGKLGAADRESYCLTGPSFCRALFQSRDADGFL